MRRILSVILVSSILSVCLVFGVSAYGEFSDGGAVGVELYPNTSSVKFGYVYTMYNRAVSSNVQFVTSSGPLKSPNDAIWGYYRHLSLSLSSSQSSYGEVSTTTALQYQYVVHKDIAYKWRIQFAVPRTWGTALSPVITLYYRPYNTDGTLGDLTVIEDVGVPEYTVDYKNLDTTSGVSTYCMIYDVIVDYKLPVEGVFCGWTWYLPRQSSATVSYADTWLGSCRLYNVDPTAVIVAEINQSINQVITQMQDLANQQQQAISDQTDQLTHGWDSSSVSPEGADAVNSAESEQKQLLDSQEDGIAEGLTIFNNLNGLLPSFIGGFKVCIGLFDGLFSSDWISVIVNISLALGIVAFTLSIAPAIFRRITRHKGGDDG